MKYKKRCHVFVHGAVQGVSFRSHMKATADRLGVRGWTKNLHGGRVEAIFEGSGEKIKEMLEWCKKGSPRASVRHIETIWEDPIGGFEGFSVIR